MIRVHAYIEVNDIQRGVAFYTGGLDLEVARWLRPHWVELAGAGIPIHILARPDVAVKLGDVELQRSYSRHWTPVHLDFLVDDLESAVARAAGAGAAVERIIGQEPWWQMANLSDPFGNGFDLIKLSSQGYDPLEIPPPSFAS